MEGAIQQAPQAGRQSMLFQAELDFGSADDGLLGGEDDDGDAAGLDLALADEVVFDGVGAFGGEGAERGLVDFHE